MTTRTSLFLKLLREARVHSKAKKLDYNLSLEFLERLWQDQRGCCALSGLPLVHTHAHEVAPFLDRKIHNVSLDRIDSTKGYTTDNVQLAAMAVNRIKYNLPDPTFIYLCTRVANFQFARRSRQGRVILVVSHAYNFRSFELKIE